MGNLLRKEWTLSISPVPLLFLALSAITLVPSYPYYVTFFYNSLGIFLLFQAARENRDVYYLMLLPIRKRDMVKARFSTVVLLQLAQMICCIPFMVLRAGYGHINNPVGIEANVAFLGLSLVLLTVFNLIFLPMHYKNGYDLGKPFLLASIAEFLFIGAAEVLSHILPYMKTVCESYAAADQLRQMPVLAAGIVIYVLGTWLAYRVSAERFEKVDL